MDDEATRAANSIGKLELSAFEREFLRFHGPLPPPPSCPIPWQPNALTPVFYGVRDYTRSYGAPENLRVFYPSLDGATFDAAILEGCGRYPLVLLAHGHCTGDAENYKKWFHLPAQLARSGYVVVVPHLPGNTSGSHPSSNEGDLAVLVETMQWARATWEHRDVLMPAPATGIVGHSYGALVGSRFAAANQIAAFASLSGVWQDWSSPPFPFQDLRMPMLFIMGGISDSFTAFNEGQWGALAKPRHRAVFASGEHWDYLPAGQTPCAPSRGPCRYMGAAAADMVTMFFAKYLAPELATDLPGRIPDNLVPPPPFGNLTFEQEFYAGAHLIGWKLIAGKTECEVAVDRATADDRVVPFVRFTPRMLANQLVENAQLKPRFTGNPGPGVAWVDTQSPSAGAVLPKGSTVTMRLRSGPIP